MEEVIVDHIDNYIKRAGTYPSKLAINLVDSSANIKRLKIRNPFGLPYRQEDFRLYFCYVNILVLKITSKCEVAYVMREWTTGRVLCDVVNPQWY